MRIRPCFMSGIVLKIIYGGDYLRYAGLVVGSEQSCAVGDY